MAMKTSPVKLGPTLEILDHLLGKGILEVKLRDVGMWKVSHGKGKHSSRR